MAHTKSNTGIIISFIVFFALAGVGIYFGMVKDTTSSGEDANKSTNMTTDSGLQITTTKDGTGETVKNGDTVSMNYTGKLDDGTVFDSNVDPKFNHLTPFEFTLGVGMVIKGWDEGILGMKVGEKRTLVIPSDLAYGDSGIPGTIPGKATLTFDVELLGIKK